MAKTDALLPVYLAVGEDSLKRNRVKDRLVKRLSALGDLSFNSDTFEGDTAAASDIIASCNTLPFASEVRLVLVQEPEKLSKADRKLLASYVENPCPSTVLAMFATKLAKNDPLYKATTALGASAVIPCAAVKKYELPKHVDAMAKTLGLKLTSDAIALLIELVGEDTVALDNELKKISLAHAGTDAVNDAEVALLVRRTTEVKPWEFVNAFSARNVRRCLYCLDRMESTSVFSLMALCSTRIRELMVTRALMRRGSMSTSALAARLGKQEWQVKNHQSWARGFSEADLRAALRSARDAEQAMKSGTDKDAAFLEWMLSVVSAA